MTDNGMLKKALTLFATVRAKLTGGDTLGEMDSSVLKVAMMVSALDGDVSADELAAFGTLARQCRGFTEAASAAVFDEGLRLAGYIVLQAKLLDEARLADVFVAEASRAMPVGFATADGADVRRAFVMWVTMALADGAFSSVERAALKALRTHLDAITGSINVYNRNAAVMNPTPFAQMIVLGGRSCPFESATTDAFMAQVESLVAKLREGAADVAAAQELETLILNG